MLRMRQVSPAVEPVSWHVVHGPEWSRYSNGALKVGGYGYGSLSDVRLLNKRRKISTPSQQHSSLPPYMSKRGSTEVRSCRAPPLPRDRPLDRQRDKPCLVVSFPVMGQHVQRTPTVLVSPCRRADMAAVADAMRLKPLCTSGFCAVELGRDQKASW